PAALLTGCLDLTPGGSDAEYRRIRGLTEYFHTELADLARASAALPAQAIPDQKESDQEEPDQENPGQEGLGRAIPEQDTPVTPELPTRYIAVLTAGACAGLWQHAQHESGCFRADPAWVVAALTRLAATPGGQPAALPEDVERRLFAQLLARHESDATFGFLD